jgi:Uma2 family endonuclease
MGADVPAPVLSRPGPWRFDELEDLPADGNRYEVVDGNLIVTPPPTDFHQLVSRALQRALEIGMPHGWEVFTDFAVRFGSDGRIADLAAVRLDQLPTSTRRNTVTLDMFGLVAEVVSPRTRKTDRFTKPGEYAEAGIPIYWRIEVEPEPQLHAFVLQAGSYVEVEGPPPTPWGTLGVTLKDLGIT